MTLQRITQILETAGKPNAVLPPTLLYNEGWMLRIVLDWFSEQGNISHELAFAKGATWYTEGLLPSRFKPRRRGDKLAESYTHADGVIGHFTMGRSGEGDVNLESNATQFVIVEAKMFSRLSKGVTHASNFDQAARNVACMAEVLRLENRSAGEFESLGFYVTAPEDQLINEASFGIYMDKDHIRDTVKERVEQYSKEKEYKEILDWYRNQFLPLLDRIDVRLLSWEKILDTITSIERNTGAEFEVFYKKCIDYNKKLKP